MDQDRGPDVRFPPPLLFVAGLGVGVVLDRYGRVPSVVPENAATQIAAFLLIIVGLAIVYVGIITFRRARTAVYPNRPATVIVQHGVYGWTRNPMYVGMTTFYVGGALLMHSLGALMLLPVVLRLLHVQVIVREERHLHAAFPEAYAAYCRRVRRWL
jgi:protein-S-isoprenylcysteine O-methyltransferase Ste14